MSRLSAVESGLETTGYLDYDELGRILDAAATRGAGPEAARRVREARDCVQTCGDPKTIFARARRALTATR